ncbi:GNAT family N-acetyltransferase [Falsiroseomonas sp. HC035]|uniref:GNAT family N-acetyltransferase n=1 Tax=Falsiroseomonas sp. HC035 TaxID=3390999 RepID=UPI003D316CC0
MPSLRARKALDYSRIGKNRLNLVSQMDLDATQVEDYLGPLSDILGAVRQGPWHSLVGIQAEGCLVGFYVVHPDRRDTTCWWLGWFILARAHQGKGLGRSILARVLAALSATPGCRRVRLIVVPGNAGAIALYAKAGFRVVDTLAATGDLVMECALHMQCPAMAQAKPRAVCAIASRRGRRRLRLRPRSGPHAARVIGVERGPPPAAGRSPGIPRPAHRPSSARRQALEPG